MNQSGDGSRSVDDDLLDPRLQQILADAFGVEEARVTFTTSFAELGYTEEQLESVFLDILLGIQDVFHLGTDLDELRARAHPRPSPTPGDLQRILQGKAAAYGKLFAVPSAKQEQQIALLVEEAIREVDLNALLTQHAIAYAYPVGPNTPIRTLTCLLSLGDIAFDEAFQEDELAEQVIAFQRAALAYKYAYLLRDAGVEPDYALMGELEIFVEVVRKYLRL